MNKTEVMKKLESLGSEQTRKTYARHGVQPPMFGVKYGDLSKVVKSIGTDHLLALELWKTGNHDARTVATMIADPRKTTAGELDEWAKTASNQLSVDSIAGLASKTPHAKKCFEKWIKSKHEWTAAAGWHILAGGCCGRPGEPSNELAELSDKHYGSYLDHIENNIHASPNRVRYSMNAALISIGSRGGELTKRAFDAAKRIGTVEVDHGDTACKTPDAIPYIKKVLEQQGRKKTTRKTAVKTPGAKKAASSVSTRRTRTGAR